jgi:hypothetical protein
MFYQAYLTLNDEEGVIKRKIAEAIEFYYKIFTPL